MISSNSISFLPKKYMIWTVILNWDKRWNSPSKALIPKNEVTRSIFTSPGWDASPSFVTSQHQQQTILTIKECFLMAQCWSKFDVYHNWSFHSLDFSCVSKGIVVQSINRRSHCSGMRRNDTWNKVMNTLDNYTVLTWIS